MRPPQTKSELPKNGARSRLPASSAQRSAAPDVKTAMVITCPRNRIPQALPGASEEPTSLGATSTTRPYLWTAAAEASASLLGMDGAPGGWGRRARAQHGDLVASTG